MKNFSYARGDNFVLYHPEAPQVLNYNLDVYVQMIWFDIFNREVVVMYHDSLPIEDIPVVSKLKFVQHTLTGEITSEFYMDVELKEKTKSVLIYNIKHLDCKWIN